LALKKRQIHIVGSPSLSLGGTTVFMDVEGLADRDFYYLVGLRYEAHGQQVEQSFWASRSEDEQDMWRRCLCALKDIASPQIVHYGAYEGRFLKKMQERYELDSGEERFVEQLIVNSVNLLSTIYGKVYFPTYSNGLKDIARFLGFEWTRPETSGAAAMLLRRCWELTLDDELRRALVTYNIEDCHAASTVAKALLPICSNGGTADQNEIETVHVASLEVGFQRTFGKFSSAMPEFEKINAAAYWDYQRSRVFVRTDKRLQRKLKRQSARAKQVVVDKNIKIDEKPTSCARCGETRLWTYPGKSHVILDLKFTRRGIKRWAVRYLYNMYRCSSCRKETTVHNGRISRYGPCLRAYVTYLLIEMRLSHQQVADHVATVFSISMLSTMVSEIKTAVARRYEPIHKQILDRIAKGPLVHADETKGVVFGGGHYVWIFANLTDVAYVYAASRDASVLNDVLSEFRGVLVSDFYGGYDAMPCAQQKCLIHLMRDINEDVVKHPFNEELTFIAKRFGALLREIVATIDAFGLRRRNLHKHKRAAEQFLDGVAALRCATESGTALQKRIAKNRDKLFAFLDYVMYHGIITMRSTPLGRSLV
jgi:Transposase IS66 family/RNase_H superfamily